MSDRSKIEWTDATWNPDTGKAGHHCVKISPACKFCYAASMNKRLGTGLDYSSSSRAEVYLDEAALQKPLRWRRPRKIFPCSMTDLFLDCYSNEQLDRVFAVMALAQRHTFQVLTKRPERMHAYLTDHAAGGRHIWEAGQTTPMPRGQDKPYCGWPLPNVQLGVTAENQEYADERIPWLVKTPAAVRFLSCEPLLGPLTFRWATWDAWKDSTGGQRATVDEFDGLRMLDWVIVGGESGQQARPMHPDWARGLRDQCQAASVPFFFKQWGEWVPWVGRTLDELPLATLRRNLELMPDGTQHTKTVGHGGVLMTKLGKKKTGRLLDGREWNEFPEMEAAHA